ncbi:two-component regulator propeller domain-containing protein [Fulvivirgaceae bacterium BMA12]|uniref:histidine kinase n=1 Tax=Agaribacillus aureus TaxID=3051825 RepID=A0ABT8LJJ6_9BACT|nr:two-component regulator propeller domain-containing protein [Fulvivirgaceae bacterium BMA12]
MKFRLIFILLLICFKNGYAQFDYLTTEEGLPHGEVTAIVQDHQGFIWFGTRSGLYRYDGYGFKAFVPPKDSLSSLRGNLIESLFLDNNGFIWIGTKSDGVSRFDPKNQTFLHLQHDDDNQKSISGNRIVFISQDHEGNLWFASRSNGINKLAWDHVNNSHAFNRYLPGIEVNSFYIDQQGIFWLATENTGLFRFDPKSEQFENIIDKLGVRAVVADRNEEYLWFGTWTKGLFRVSFDQLRKGNYTFVNYKSDKDLSADAIFSLYFDRDDDLWVGTWGGGLKKYLPETDQFQGFKKDYFSSNSLTHDIVLSIYEDDMGMLWVGTNGGGVNKMDKRRKKFYHLSFDPFNQNSLSSEHVLSIFKTGNQAWIGLNNGGLNKVTFRSKRDYTISRYSSILNSYYHAANNISAVLKDSEHNFWIGDLDHGLFFCKGDEPASCPGLLHFLPDTGQFGIKGRKITRIYEDSDKNIWIGTQRDGLMRVEKGKNGNLKRFIKYRFEAVKHNDLGHSRITSIVEDKFGFLWVGTFRGLYKLSRSLETRLLGDHVEPDQTVYFKDYIINAIFFDEQDKLWIGTPDGLLEVTFEKDTRSIKAHNFKQGLTSNIIKSIVGDDNGKIWVSTNGGISQVTANSGDVRNYDRSDGLKNSWFSHDCVFKDAEGWLYFGGHKGVSYFHPDSIIDNLQKPQLAFTNLYVNGNQEVKVGETYFGEMLLPQAVNYTDAISLNHKIREITLEFSSFDFTANNNLLYKYKIEGYHDDWINIGTQRSIAINNLSGGEYEVKVSAANGDGYWNEQGISMKLDIMPAPWKTWWAYTSYFIVVLLIIFFMLRTIILQNNLRNRLKLIKFQREKELELNDLKLRFFTNISHELRTPLTLIKGPLQDLMSLENSSNFAKDKYRLMSRSVNRLLKLVNQLLEFRKVETENMVLKISKSDIIKFCKEVFDSFDDPANEKKLVFSFLHNVPIFYLYFDREKIETICYNLLSNAIKFSPEKEKVTVTLRAPVNQGEYFEIVVADNGKGIAPGDTHRIFDRFYQAKDSIDNNTGSGVGLALVKRLVTLHSGTIQVESVLGKGSKFIVRLPADDSWFRQLDNYQVVEDSDEKAVTDRDGDRDYLHDFEHNQEVSTQSSVHPDTNVMMLVEDNVDLRYYLKTLFDKDFDVVEAKDGNEGLDKVNRLIPDVIISDIMMPEMDGIEFCRRIKNDVKTSHIPIILLTAKTASESQMTGIKTGADDYIGKPFNPEILKAKVNSLLKNRSKLMQYFKKQIILQPSEIPGGDGEEEFLRSAVKIVEQNLNSPTFTTQDMLGEMGMSQPTLYRKLKALTGYSISQFIRSVRLKRAAQMLQTGKYNISDAAYSSGFNDLKHFRKSFQKQYGMTPTEYKAANGQKGTGE